MRIAVLEKILSEECKKAGQTLFLRIIELEGNLEAERSTLHDLEELPAVVHVSHSSCYSPNSKATTMVFESEVSNKELKNTQKRLILYCKA